MTQEEKYLITHWFDHIAQMADDRKTLNGNVMDDAHCLDEIRVLAVNSSEFVEKFWDNKEAWKTDEAPDDRNDGVLIKVSAHVRYWDDGKVNGEYDDPKNPKMPCAEGEYWKPVIVAKTGQILNWTKGVEANVHYKVCDECGMTVKHGNVNLIFDEDYVPDFLCPKEEGYGDYIIMDIDKDGFIQNWTKKDISKLLIREAIENKVAKEWIGL